MSFGRGARRRLAEPRQSKNEGSRAGDPAEEPGDLLHRVREAFSVEPDNATILQGKRHFRQGLPHVRVVHAPSPKNEGLFIPCEGRLEGALAVSLEIDPDIAAFRTQALWLRGPSGRDLVCDFAVKTIKGDYRVVDVKPWGHLSTPKVAERMEFVRKRLASACLPHRIVTERDLEREPARQIRDQLRKGAPILLSELEQQLLLSILKVKPRRVGEARRIASECGLHPFCIETLAIRGLLTFPINAPWRETTFLGVFDGPDHALAPGWGSVRDVVVPV